ncbi:E3 ubiquitin-protein ligase TRIM71, partial [Nosema granulosis]
SIAALPNIPLNARWTQKGVTVAGGHGDGSASNQLNSPFGLHVDEDQTVFIADYGNHRIVEWKRGDTSGRVVAGGNEEGSGTDQLNGPIDVIVDKETDILVICELVNRRVMQWSRQSGTTSGEIIIDDIDCVGLILDDERFLYVSDYVKHEVRRYRMGEKTKGIVVAGGNGKGDRLNQLSSPRHVFVDREYSVYVSDKDNHRVMKWMKGATEGFVVAGGRGEGDKLTQLSYPQGVCVTSLGTVYVADKGNNRVMRWHQGASQGTVVVGGNGRGKEANQLSFPQGLSFDRQGNLYVVDTGNARVQRFSIETS